MEADQLKLLCRSVAPVDTVATEAGGMALKVYVDRAEAMGAMIREDFPATLFFSELVELDGDRAQIEVPLADALTTYRLEAIAWTASGWTTSGAGRLRVDQRAAR